MTMFKSLKRSVLAASLLVASPLALANLHFLVPGGPGGGWDTTARGVGEAMVKAGIEDNASFQNMSGGGGGRAVLRTHVRALIAALVAGGAGWLVLRVNPDAHAGTGWGAIIVAGILVVVAGTVMFIVYAAMLRILRVEEFDQALAPIKRKLGRK